MRRLSLGFIVVLVTAFIVVACGRQVTPNPPGLGPGGAPPGYLAIHFDVAAPLNFPTYQYMVVFNTTGSGQTPSTDTLQTNWAGYSFALVALGSGGTAFAEPVQFVPNKNPHISPNWLTLGHTPQNFFFNPNSNGSQTEFSILVQKQVIHGITSPPPSPTPTPSTWTFNIFTTQGAGPGNTWTFVDSMGAGGPVDPQYVSPTLNMAQCFDNTYFPLGNFAPPDPAAQIVSVELSNNPSPGPHSSPC